MEIFQAGARNLAGFIRGTAGRIGTSADVRGGVVVAGPLAIPNAYVTAAIPTRTDGSPAEFLDDAIEFFGSLSRKFMLWAPVDGSSLVEEAIGRGLTPDSGLSPVMVATSPSAMQSDLDIRVVHDDSSAATFGEISERGYGAPGMAYLLAHQQSYAAEGSRWFIAYEGDTPVSVACGFLADNTGGIYSVATPAEYRGRGYGAVVSAVATNDLFERGAQQVVLQSSPMGFRVYERLGYTVYGHYQRFTIEPDTRP